MAGSLFMRTTIILRRSLIFVPFWFPVILFMLLLGFTWQTSSGYRDWKDEFTRWSKIIEREPNSHRAHSSLRILLIKKRLKVAATSELQKSLSGNLYVRQHQYNNAICEFKEALYNQKEDLDTLKNLGNTYCLNELWDEAIKIFEEILIHQDDDIDIILRP